MKKGRMKLNVTKETYQYIPVLKTLKALLSHPDILDEENGVEMNINGTDKIFRGSIGPFSGDNLGSHLIGGFTESFNTLRICRICLASKNDIQVKFTEEQFQPRTRESHDRQCKLVKNDSSLSSAYGVKRDSVLNQSRYFHVVDGLDLDVMHDQLEGVLPLDLKMLLQKFIQSDHAFTLKTLNERIASFHYGPIDCKNEPSPLKEQVLISDSGSISQTAAQMWCLSRMLPLLIGDLIPPEEDGVWNNFLRLLQIEEIIFAPTSSVQLAAYLAILVKDYLETFSELYTRNLIPKQHYMVHYARQIIRRGPLVRNWAMHFEAKHFYFKKLVQKINNFKNIDLSLAKRHQALQAYLLQGSPGSLTKSSLELVTGKSITVGDSGLEAKLLELNQAISQTSLLTMSSWIKVLGTKYAVGCVIITGLTYGIPSFGEVDGIILVDGSIVIFKYKTLHVIEYEEHLNAYRVELVNDVNLVMQENLIDFHPLGLHKGFASNGNKLFVVLRYRIDYMQ